MSNNTPNKVSPIIDKINKRAKRFVKDYNLRMIRWRKLQARIMKDDKS